MDQTRQHVGMGVIIAVGFLAILILMVSLTVVGLRYVTDANQRLRDIALNNNTKTHLANVMNSTLRERALSMHSLPILTDPFDKDEEIQRFNRDGATYIDARQHLESMRLTQEESDILARIRELTHEAQPEVQAVINMAIFNQDQAGIFERIRSVAMPRQRAIADQLSLLLDLQRRQTATAVHDAEAAYVQVRDLMFLLGAVALILGLAIAWFVSRRVTRQAQQLSNQAMYDPLTGLANRSLLQFQLEHEIARSTRDGTSFGVLLMDLDQFKAVNDTLGHEVGDELLREVGKRLKAVVRDEDTVARLGGDEFVILLNDLELKDVQRVSIKILASLDQPFHWQNQSIDLGASVGVSLYPSQCTDSSTLIRCADIAMYVAKRSGSGYAIYAPDQEHNSRGDLSLKSELREAIHSDQLTLFYQPQIDHRRNCVVGLEALVRWNHPQRGFLLPDKFIPLAEEAGLIGPLTQWVLKTALAEIAQLRAEGYSLTMAVNLSARNLHDITLPATIEDRLKESGVAPEHLKLEITESAVMSNPVDGLTILTQLNRMGVILSIDDFGTGYSSLSYLKQLPVEELKIDKSFVMDMQENENDAVIVRSTIDLAHNLGLRVTAEGVETQGDWDLLQILGCDRSQGYFMGRPMSSDKMREWLQVSVWKPSGAATAASSALG